MQTTTKKKKRKRKPRCSVLSLLSPICLKNKYSTISFLSQDGVPQFSFRDSLHFVNKQQDFIFLCKLPEYTGDFLSLLEIRKQVLFCGFGSSGTSRYGAVGSCHAGGVLLTFAAFVNELVLEINPNLILLTNSALHV